jgi:putative SOS response-associated peptidase YedK
MPTYEFWYSEEYAYKAWFEAKDEEEAQKLLDRVQEGKLELEELPNFGNKSKTYDIVVEHSTLEEI